MYSVNRLKQSTIDPAYIYAYEKTGLVFTGESTNQQDDYNYKNWKRFVDKYRKENGLVS